MIMETVNDLKEYINKLEKNETNELLKQILQELKELNNKYWFPNKEDWWNNPVMYDTRTYTSTITTC